MCSHRVQFYDSSAFLVKTVGAFIEHAQRAGDGVIIIATQDHLNALQTILGAAPNAARCDSRDHRVFLDARDTLATFMVDGQPDEQRFIDVVGGLARQVSDNGSRPVSAFGEMVALLYTEGHAQAAIRLEQLWQNLIDRHQINLLCAYPLAAFPDEAHSAAFQCICAAHAQVNPIERLGADIETQELHRTVALLQQRADALESELRRAQEVERVLALQNARIAAMASAQDELESLAGHDALTGLPNRRIFTDRLTHAVERATRTGHPLALIYIDLDEFKALNDRHGHAAGDQLLKQVAARLSVCMRTADTVCRWGGDEFAVIAEDADAAQAAVLLRRVMLALGEPFFLGDISIDVSASVGLSLYPDDAGDAQALVDSADKAMYRAKRSSKSGHLEAAAKAMRPQAAPTRSTGELRGGDGEPAMLTVEAAAGTLCLSRPHVLKLIAERRFKNIVLQEGGTPLIPLHEVSRVALEMRD